MNNFNFLLQQTQQAIRGFFDKNSILNTNESYNEINSMISNNNTEKQMKISDNNDLIFMSYNLQDVFPELIFPNNKGNLCSHLKNNEK